MMIRSMPPASADFAEMPVPAPPPMIGRPSVTFWRSLASAVLRSMSVPSCAGARSVLCGDQGVQPPGGLPPEPGVVDVLLGLDQLHGGAGQGAAQRVEECGVGLRVVERLAVGVDTA